MQHRGQESAGIAVSDADHIMVVQGHGPGLAGLQRADAQHPLRPAGHRSRPLLHHRLERVAQRAADPPGAQRRSAIALAHNGNLVNTDDLRAVPERTRHRSHRELGHRGDGRPAGRSPGRRRQGRGARGHAHAARRLQRRRAHRARGDGLPRPLRHPAAGAGAARRPVHAGQRDGGAGHPGRGQGARDRARGTLLDRRGGLPPRAGRPARARGALHLRVHLLRPARFGDEGPDPLRRPQPHGRGVGGRVARRRRPGHPRARHRATRPPSGTRRGAASPSGKGWSRTATSAAPSSSPTTACAGGASA